MYLVYVYVCIYKQYVICMGMVASTRARTSRLLDDSISALTRRNVEERRGAIVACEYMGP